MPLTRFPPDGASPRGTSVVDGHAAQHTVVRLRGEHDIATAGALSQTMDRAMGLDDADILVDLSEVEFMGAATVDVLMDTCDSLRPHSRCLALRSPSRAARLVLDVCGLNHLVASPGRCA